MEVPEEEPEITEQSLLGNVPPVNATNVVNIPEENPINEHKENNKENNKKNNNKKNKNTPILYNAESEEIVYKNIQNLSPNNLYKETTRVFQNNPNIIFFHTPLSVFAFKAARPEKPVAVSRDASQATYTKSKES